MKMPKGVREGSRIVFGLALSISLTGCSSVGSASVPSESDRTPEKKVSVEEPIRKADAEEAPKTQQDAPEPGAPEPGAPEPGATESEKPEAEKPEPKKMSFSVRDLPVEVTVPLYVRNWANAWGGQDVDAYFTSYSSKFVPEDDRSRESWEAARAERIESREFIQLSFSDLEYVVKETENVTIRFEQTYHSDTYGDRVLKELEMELTDDGWKIVAERVVETLE